MQMYWMKFLAKRRSIEGEFDGVLGEWCLIDWLIDSPDIWDHNQRQLILLAFEEGFVDSPKIVVPDFESADEEDFSV